MYCSIRRPACGGRGAAGFVAGQASWLTCSLRANWQVQDVILRTTGYADGPSHSKTSAGWSTPNEQGDVYSPLAVHDGEYGGRLLCHPRSCSRECPKLLA